jgi:hypothetical protein
MGGTENLHLDNSGNSETSLIKSVRELEANVREMNKFCERWGPGGGGSQAALNAAHAFEKLATTVREEIRRLDPDQNNPVRVRATELLRRGRRFADMIRD